MVASWRWEFYFLMLKQHCVFVWATHFILLQCLFSKYCFIHSKIKFIYSHYCVKYPHLSLTKHSDGLILEHSSHKSYQRRRKYNSQFFVKNEIQFNLLLINYNIITQGDFRSRARTFCPVWYHWEISASNIRNNHDSIFSHQQSGILFYKHEVAEGG